MPPNLADLARCQKRMAQILVSGPDDGSYAATSADQGKYIAQDVTDALLETDLEICRMIQETVGHGFRSQYGAMSAAAIAYGATLVAHPGKVGNVEIQLTGNAWHPGILAENLEVIRKIKLNPDGMYGGTTENEGRYYISEELKIYYVGLDARLFIPADLVITAALQAPAVYEATILRGAIKALVRDPVDSNLATYGIDYNRDLSMIAANAAAVPPLDSSTKTGG